MTSCFLQLHQERERLDAMMAHLKMEGRTIQNGSESMDIGPIGNPLKSSLSLGNKSSSEVNSKHGYPVTGMKNGIECGLAIDLQQKNSTFDASSYIATYVWS